MTSAAVDNDVIHKGCAYGLLDALLADVDEPYVLGAARFVLTKKITRRAPMRGADPALGDLLVFIARANLLEPTPDEVTLAATLETAALTQGLPLDGGESQLAAAVIHRGIDQLVTGDKRAIKSMAQLSDCESLDGRVVCLEQLIARLITRQSPERVKAAICADQAADVALSSCFACRSPEVQADQWSEGLESFISNLRNNSGNLLVED